METPVLTTSFVAGADLSTNQYGPVALDADGKAVIPAAGAKAIGIQQNDPKAGQVAAVMLYGIADVKVSTAVVPGDDLVVTAGGTLGVNAAVKNTVATALVAGASGQIIGAVIRPASAQA